MIQSTLIQDLAKNLSALSETLTAIAGQEDVSQSHSSSKDTAPKASKAKAEKDISETVPEVTIEEVRAVLAEVSQAGGTSKVKELLTKFGAAKLSAVDPSKYGELLEAAKALK